MAKMTIADEMMRRKLDPRFDLEKSIEWYSTLAKKWRDFPPPSEAAAEQWQSDMEKAAAKIKSIYAAYPHLIGEQNHA